MKGIISSIQRFSIQDGPGIRTTVFLKGCPLHCLWCSNPETQRPCPQISFVDDLCFSTDCVQCVLVCKDQALRRIKQKIFAHPEKCSLCGKCIQSCPESNLKVIGQAYTVDELIAEVLKDKVFYSHSGGGITLSGGEPLFQSEFCSHFLERCKDLSLHTVVDTSASVKWEDIESVKRYTDLFYVDLKHVDDRFHQKYVGASNQLILRNLERMSEEISPEKMVIRIPFIPQLNGDKPSIERMGRYLKGLKIRWPVHLLPYHSYGQRKYRLLGREFSYWNIHFPTEMEMRKGVETYRRMGIRAEVIR